MAQQGKEFPRDDSSPYKVAMADTQVSYRAVLVTGASSGIGAALARTFAAPGVFLALAGRDRDRLNDVASRCRSDGAETATAVLDVQDRVAMAVWIAEVDAAHPLDLVVANAGISGGSGGRGESEAQARAIFDVNVTGVLNTVWPAIDAMRKRQRGQIAVMSSIAGFRGLPGAPAYSASKAAVKAYGEALRGWLAADGIRVSVICPGYVESRMTAANDFPMPFLMSAERAARVIRRGLLRNRARIVFPWPLTVAAWLLGALPPAWTDFVVTRLPKKK
jgi:short-subunit dehydrogenase